MERPRRPAEAVHVGRGSRFLALLAPAGDLAAARSVVERRAREHPDATHHCSAYRVWHGAKIRAAGFDAGEPTGTAGRPILGALERRDVVGAVGVVSRWLGGIKVGTGGLTRAYGEAARAAVETARERGFLESVRLLARFRMVFDYSSTGPVERVMAAHGVRRTGSGYDVRTRLEVALPVGRAETFAADLTEATGGGVELERLADIVGPV